MLGKLVGRRRPTGIIDVAVIQSLNRKQVVDDIVANYGHVIVDECHHLSAVSFEQVLRQVKARYITGLTATPKGRLPTGALVVASVAPSIALTVPNPAQLGSLPQALGT